jgi:hypothetical protein
MVKTVIYPFTSFPTQPHVGDSKVCYKQQNAHRMFWAFSHFPIILPYLSFAFFPLTFFAPFLPLLSVHSRTYNCVRLCYADGCQPWPLPVVQFAEPVASGQTRTAQRLHVMQRIRELVRLLLFMLLLLVIIRGCGLRRSGTSDGPFCTRQWTFGRHDRRGVSWVAKRL